MPTKISELTLIRCGGCGIEFAVPEWWRHDRKETGKTFWCPNGDGRAYSETEAKRLQREVSQLRRRVASTEEDVRAAQADAQVERHRARAYKGKTTMLKRRVAAGKCVCCSRRFEDLATHMQEAHPGFGEDEQ